MKTRADNNDAFPESGNVRMRQVVQFLAMSESSVYRLIKTPTFPAPSTYLPDWWFSMPLKSASGSSAVPPSVNPRSGMSRPIPHHETRPFSL
ncbi:Predicted transcriptional regulator [Klebsiella pneumoniae]|uniref:AlpA family phage regulatory protein n=1 Tax=Klebsiella pneumoniae TaxID=573 RepID=UPI0006585385|nr:hypothetical protein SL56_02399 [Klebsiella pneumoniae]STV51650.1 Predicted transcriptional regulator [Klebsiella pneumoniae]